MTIEPFSDDAPKTNPWSEDRLGYRPFSQRLANVILNLSAPTGYVIGLHGPWGSGKSSALNFVQSYLRKHDQERGEGEPGIQTVLFQPWIISGHQDLVGGFFKVLSESLADRAEKRRKHKRRFLRFAKSASDPLINAAATVGVALSPASGFVTKAGAAVASSSISSAIDRWLEEPSLQSAYEDLKARLLSRGDRFLVVIDDIDRLQPSEIRSIMQMVKTVGKLPNVIYLLAYDRRIVWNALDLGVQRDASEPSFAEKIIQHEVELPHPPRRALLRLLDAQIGFLSGPTIDGVRWHCIVQAGIYRWIRHPRDVSRLANALKFAWPALEGEIDPQDFIAMEGIRLFDADLFAWVRHNRDFLLTQGRFQVANEEKRIAVGVALRASLPATSREDQIELLATLFAPHSKVIRGEDSWSNSEPYFQLIKRRGIASEAGYDAYFSLYPSPNAVPKSAIDAAIAELDDEEAQFARLKEYLGKVDEAGAPLIGGYLEELQYRFLGTDAAMPTKALLKALFRSGSEILAIDRHDTMFASDARTHLRFLIRRMLELWQPAGAGAALCDAFDASETPALAADIWVSQAQALGVLPAERGADERFIIESDLATLGAKLCEIIERCAANHTLEEAPFYFDIIRAWAHFRGPEPVRAWLKHGLDNSAQFLVRLSRGYLAHSVGERNRVYSYSGRPTDELVSSVDLLKSARKFSGDPSLSPDGSARIAALTTGLEQQETQAGQQEE